MYSVTTILRDLKLGKIKIEDAERLLRLDTITVLGDIARLDDSRYLRRGVPEIIYAAGKNSEQLSAIVRGVLKKRINGPYQKDESPLLISKVKDSSQLMAIKQAFNTIDLNNNKKKNISIRSYDDADIVKISFQRNIVHKSTGKVALISAGTSDSNVLSEAEIVLQSMDCETLRFNDVGVAALHRLKEPMKKIVKFDPDCIIVAAGMEGALPSVIAGLSSVPVIGLPTSVGYGYGRGGEAALMSMLQACPLGMCVVNIDAGVAAGIVAYLICRRAKGREKGTGT